MVYSVVKFVIFNLPVKSSFLRCFHYLTIVVGTNQFSVTPMCVGPTADCLLTDLHRLVSEKLRTSVNNRKVLTPPRASVNSQQALLAIYIRARMRTFWSFTPVGVLAIYISVRVKTFQSFAQVRVLLLRHKTASMIQQNSTWTRMCVMRCVCLLYNSRITNGNKALW